MKRIFSAALILLMLVLSVSVIAETETFVVENCAEWVSLRKSPAVNARRIVKVPKGAVVTLVSVPEKSDDFYEVEYNGQTGYILRCTLAGGTPIQQPSVRWVGDGAGNGAKLRSGPSEESSVVETLERGTEVVSYGVVSGADGNSHNIAGNDNLFEYVEVNGEYGFIPVGRLSCIPLAACDGIEGATLVWYPDGENAAAKQVVLDASVLDELEMMFLNSRVSLMGQCPYDALLTLNMHYDGSEVYFKVATDGCRSLLSPDGAVYEFTEAFDGAFWNIFGEVYAEITAE